MFERTKVDNAPEPSAVPVEVVLADGTLTKGKLLVSAGKTLSDALNGTAVIESPRSLSRRLDSPGSGE